jgi:FlaA1/EpsC-like NDP-sugar epimerase
MIQLSGRHGIEIKEIGLRPGEKLYEEKLMAEEGLRKTPNNLIHIGNPVRFDYDQFLLSIDDLMKQAYANDEGIRESVRKMVATYHDENIDAYELDPKYKRMLECCK